MICEKMETYGIRNKAAYSRKMAIDGYCVRLEIEELKKLLYLLGKCSGNLNQYAKRANAFGDIYRCDMKALQKEFGELREQAERIVDRLTELS